jgi:hypothetical protein
MKVEKIKADVEFALIEEHVYGNVLKCIKGACAQLIEGECAFSALYTVTEGEYTRELVLKASCCGKDTISSYVAGVHFTLKDLVTFGVKKRVKGRQIWAIGLTVMHSIKKALSMVPKLSPSIFLGKTLHIPSFSKTLSPWTFCTFCVIPEQGKCVETFLFVPMRSTK